MINRILQISMLLMLLISCKNYEDHQLKIEKLRESVNAVKFSISLIGDDFIQVVGTIKYKDILLHKFGLESTSVDTPSEYLINFSESPGITQQLAVDFVLNRKPKLEIFIEDKEKEFSRTGYLELNPDVPPIMTGIELKSKDITREYPISYKSEIYEMDFYLLENDIWVDKYILERMATVSLLIKNNSKILLTVAPVGDDIPIYRGRKFINATVMMDSISLNPYLILYPAKTNKYYDGPGLYEIANAYYTEENTIKETVNIQGDKFVISKRFNVEKLIGEYDLMLIISEGLDKYFYYDIGSVIFDNVAPEFNEWALGNYYFGGNESYEGKVYLGYTIPVSSNPYEVIFSGKVFGDVKNISIDGRQFDVKGKSDILVTKKIYISDGYKDVNVGITDIVGNLKNYTIPIIVGN